MVSIIISAAPKYSFATWGSSQAALYKHVSPIRYPKARATSPSDTTFSTIFNYSQALWKIEEIFYNLKTFFQFSSLVTMLTQISSAKYNCF